MPEEQTQTSTEQVETVDISPEVTSNDILSDVQTEDNTFRSPIIARADTPTNPIPKTFKEQFYFKTDGTLWINMDGTWEQFVTPTSNVATGNGTSPASISTQDITCGFRPKVIQIKAETPDVGTSFGTASGTANEAQQVIPSYVETTGSTYLRNTLTTAYIVQIGDHAANYILGKISFISNDMFRINWTQTDDTCGYIWTAWG